MKLFLSVSCTISQAIAKRVRSDEYIVLGDLKIDAINVAEGFALASLCRIDFEKKVDSEKYLWYPVQVFER